MAAIAYDIGYNTLRDKQDEVAAKLETELTRLAGKGKTLQYTLMGMCTGLVVLISVATIPVFMRVVKSKSSVLAIFADIKPEEAEKIIDESRKLDIKNLKYKAKWIAKCQGRKNLFWRKLLAEQQKGFGQTQRNPIGELASLKPKAPEEKLCDEPDADSSISMAAVEKAKEVLAARRRSQFQRVE